MRDELQVFFVRIVRKYVQGFIDSLAQRQRRIFEREFTRFDF